MLNVKMGTCGKGTAQMLQYQEYHFAFLKRVNQNMVLLQ